MLFFGALRILFHISHTRSVTTDVVQGILVGAALAFITVLVVLPNFYVTKVNGWTTMFGCGEPGSGLLLRAACNVTCLKALRESSFFRFHLVQDHSCGYT